MCIKFNLWSTRMSFSLFLNCIYMSVPVQSQLYCVQLKINSDQVASWIGLVPTVFQNWQHIDTNFKWNAGATRASDQVSIASSSSSSSSTQVAKWFTRMSDSPPIKERTCEAHQDLKTTAKLVWKEPLKPAPQVHVEVDAKENVAWLKGIRVHVPRNISTECCFLLNVVTASPPEFSRWGRGIARAVQVHTWGKGFIFTLAFINDVGDCIILSFNNWTVMLCSCITSFLPIMDQGDTRSFLFILVCFCFFNDSSIYTISARYLCANSAFILYIFNLLLLVPRRSFVGRGGVHRSMKNFSRFTLSKYGLKNSYMTRWTCSTA